MGRKRDQKGQVAFTFLEEKRCQISFSGCWTVYSQTKDVLKKAKDEILKKDINLVEITTKGLKSWDSLFVTTVEGLCHLLRKKGIDVKLSSIPEGALKLLELSRSTRPIKASANKKEGLFERVGKATTRITDSIVSFHAFLGQVTVAVFNILTARAHFRFSDFLLYTQNAGARALPIVSLVSLLVGLILAFVATVQLKLFGAQIFVADLVGIAMARDMGAMMCGIIMAGRTGATYAAQIGTMQVNEEIDALRTFGFDPIEFLVVPRLFALTLMMPLLCIYSDLLGIAGGALVGVGFSDITLLQYITETKNAVPLTHFSIGIFKALVYGVIVAIIGCQKGLSCGRSASEVGRVTTSAVVTSIVWIIVSCAIITYICYVYDI